MSNLPYGAGGGSSPLQSRFWGAILDELGRGGLGLEDDAQQEIQSLIDTGVQNLATATPAQADGAEKKIRLFGRELASESLGKKLKKVTRKIVDKVKGTLCPLYPFC